MKFETRIELAILIVAAVILGGWIGLRMARSKASVGPSGRADTDFRVAVVDREGPALTGETDTVPEDDKAPGTARDAGTSQAPAPRLAEDVKKARDLIADEQLFEARALLTKLILAAAEDKTRAEIKEILDQINRTLFFSRAPSKGCAFYKIQAGDSLALIAKKHGKDYYFSKLIQEINGIRNARRIRVGKKIKIPQGEFSVLVQKRAHRLIVFLNGHYIKEYPVGIGAPASPTPEETFRVATKEVEPAWYAPDGRVYEFGHPKNILGTRWVGFEEKGEHQSYGIHGTTNSSSIGKSVSNGCIRMLNKDVEELFSMLMKGNTVKIVK